MELWVSGFNAWGQLDFEGEAFTASQDLRIFKCVLRSKHIEILRTVLSATLGKTEKIPVSLLFSVVHTDHPRRGPSSIYH